MDFHYLVSAESASVLDHGVGGRVAMIWRYIVRRHLMLENPLSRRRDGTHNNTKLKIKI